MAIIVKVTRKTKPETIQKALRKMAGKRAAGNKKTIADFMALCPARMAMA
ncbi:MAG: hypothetical protein UZ12_BCD005001162 [Bacteroidetes bacterium OLB12]|nr:MAG: hypothetical protein UZ12_BCD005001162 [Bacteroidetes bacterium OLB12]